VVSGDRALLLREDPCLLLRSCDQPHDRFLEFCLDRLAKILIEQETIEKDQFEHLLRGEPEQNLLPNDSPPKQPNPTRPKRKRAPKPQPALRRSVKPRGAQA
jgi:hypothetical protein